MTREEIMAMPECLDLDHLVAEKVMHWHREGSKWMRADGQHTGYVVESAVEYPFSSFRPSIDISDAWEVVEHSRSRGWYFTLKNGVCLQPLQAIWEAEVFEGELMVADAVGQCVAYRQEVARATTAPLAICRVALLTNLQPA